MLKRLVQQSSTYALVNVVAKISGFALMALYGDPSILSEADFGLLGGMNAVMMFAMLVGGIGLPLGIIRFASDPSLSDADRDGVPVTALMMSAVSGAVVAGLGWAYAEPAAAVFLKSSARSEPIRWLSLFVGFKVVSEVSYTVLRQREKAGAFALVGAAEALLLVAAVAWFLLDGQGLAGVMKGYALSAGVTAAVVTPLLLSKVSRAVRWRLVGSLAAFGLPLIVSGLAGRFLNLGDRYLIIYLVSEEAAAVYEWAARFGGIVNTFLVQSFTLAFTVLGMKALDRDGSPELHRQSFRHFVALAGWLVLGITLFVDDLSRGIADSPAYYQTEGLVLLIAGGFAFYGLYYVAVTVLYVAGRTRAVAASVGAAAALNLALNLALIPTMGIAGAALATLVSYAALAVGTARLAQASTPVAYSWRSLGVVVALTVGLWGVATVSAGWGLVPRLAFRAALALAYLPGLWLLRVYRRDDWDRALALLRREHRGSTPGQGGGRVDAGGGRS